MELSLNTLVEQLDDLFFERATRAYRVEAGIEPGLAKVPELPPLVRLDAWQVVNEVLASPRVDEAKRGRLELLRRHVARAFVDAAIAGADAQVERFLSSHTFTVAARTWTPTEARRELPHLSGREGRGAVEGEWSSVLDQNRGLAARRLEGVLEALAALKLDVPQFVERTQGRPLAERLTTAGAVLTATRDAHQDLLGFALKRVDPQLTPRVARAHDARRAVLAPWLFESFRKEDLMHALQRCLGDLGLSLNADGRLTIDQEPRPGRSTEAQVFELRVPDQTRLLLTAGAGLETYAGWLGSWGLGLHRAHVGRTLPFVERRLGDRSVLHAVSLLFETFLLDEGWLKRYLRLTATQAREAARVAAFRQLHLLRQQAALAGFTVEALARGSSANLSDDYRARLSEGLGVEVPRGEALFSIDPGVEALLRVDAHGLEQVWRTHLRERFNEDFWRNPATGRWLTALAARGQRDDALALAQQLGATSLPVLDAANHRVQVMGA